MNRKVEHLFLGLLCLVVLGAVLPGVAGEVLLGAVVVIAMAISVWSAARLRGSLGWRWLTAGGLLIGISPAVTFEIFGSSFPWTAGDLIALSGYVAFVVGLEIVLRARTASTQLPVFLDAALVASWVVTASVAATEGAILQQVSGLEAAVAFSYLPCTGFLLLQLLRLILGSPGRSRSFTLLAGCVAAAALSELFFLVHAAGFSYGRPIALGLASAGLLGIAAAVSHPSAIDLERPASGSFKTFQGTRAAFLVVSIAALVALSASSLRTGSLAFAGVVVITALSCARLLVLLRERDQWVDHERRVHSLIADFMDAKEEESVLADGIQAVEHLLLSYINREVDFLRLVGGNWRVIGSEGEPGQVHNSVLYNEASSTGQTVQSDFAFGRRYGTELAVPVNCADGSAMLLSVETSPVLDATKIAQIESIATSTSLALRALDVRERSHQERSHRRFRTLVQDTNDIVVLVSPETRAIQMVSPTVERLLGHNESDYLGQSPFQHMRSEDRVKVETELAAQPGTASLAPTDVRLQHSDGQYHWFSVSVRDLSDEEEISGHLYSFSDINDRKMAELQVLSSERRYRSLVKNASDVFAIIDGESRITFVSPNVKRLLGFGPDDLIGTLVRGLLTERGEQTINEALERHGGVVGSTLELQLRTQDGREREAEVRFSNPGLGDDEDILLTVHDVTEQRRLEEGLRTQAFTDSLTGLLNRASIYPRLQQMLQSMENGTAVGVLHLNVNEFSAINESVGFGAGDQILVEIATRLRGTLRPDDVLARVGGDEFTVLSAAPTVFELSRFGERLSHLFEQPFSVGDRHVSLSATVGLATTDDRRMNATTLLENGALAVRAASRRVGEGIVTFDASMRLEAAERFELASDLLDAITEGQFSVVYQPVFDLGSNRVSSLEALLRWKHPDRGHVSPGVFIPLAERTGAIVELGRWVLRQACEQLADWHVNLAGGMQLGMAVNVSARQLEVEGEVDILLGVIAETGVNPAALTIELTESTLIEDTALLRTQLEQFRRIGVRIAVDDFGTGAAGIGHLRDVSFDVLKIDKSYIDDISVSGDAASLVAGVIELAHGMNAKLVAEGIEMPAQSAILKELGCDYGQGFFLGRPMDSNSIQEWFAQGREGAVASLILTESAW